MSRLPQLNRRVLLLEGGILLAAALYYEFGTFFFRAAQSVADAHAVSLWNLEQAWGLFVEPAFQSFFSAKPTLLWLLILFYVGPHFLLTLGFLAWSYWYRFPSYPHVRDSFLAFTLLAFGFQWLYPLSPPRYIPAAGLSDSVRDYFPLSGETPWIKSMTNPYAALPSVHFGWSLLVAVLAIRLMSGPWRWLWLTYPAAIGLSILATGNHWVLDLGLSVVFLAATEVALALRPRLWSARSSHRIPAPVPAAEPGEAP